MTHESEDALGRRAGFDRRPTDERGLRAINDEDTSIPGTRGAVDQGVDDPPRSSSGEKCRRRSVEPGGPESTQSPCLHLTRRMALLIACEHVLGEDRLFVTFIGNLHRPQRSLHAGEIGRVGDPLMAKELRPRSHRSVRKIVRRALAWSVPTSWPLGGRRPEERIARITVTEDDHVAPPETRLSARSRTRRTAGALGFQLLPSTCRGLRSSSWARGRSNQRRMPMAL